jgi:hypothetical protein
MLLISQGGAELTATASKGDFWLYEFKNQAEKLGALQPDYSQCTDDDITTLTFVFRSAADAQLLYDKTVTRRRQ